MSRYAPAARPLVQSLRRADFVLPLRPAAKTTTATTATTATSTSNLRSFSVSARQWQDTTTTTTPPPPTTASTIPAPETLEGWELDPNLTTLPWAEKELMRRGTPPVGSRRRRAALRGRTLDWADAEVGVRAPVPFELMPYQCFQEARKVLQADRAEKLQQIAAEAAKVARLEAVEAEGAKETSRGGAAFRAKRLASLRAHVEQLKILADINDPQVKRRFEDGLGDMNKPIYRYLAEQRWRGRPLRLLQQRIAQFHVAPDLLAPSQLVPRADVELFFRSYRVAPGAFVDSLISEVCPRLRVQVFDRGPRLVTVAVVDADVPDLDRDRYTRRCHFLAANVPLAPTDASLPLARLDPAAQVVLPWLPAFAQKGSPPHRLAVFVLQQPGPVDQAALRATYSARHRDGFSVRRFVAAHRLDPVGCTLFRTQWDAGTEGVMTRAGIPGADVELRPLRLPSLKPHRKARGWEAKHQGPKYRHLWKYTHRIATPKRKFVR